jgi:predicted dehydrogenase
MRTVNVGLIGAGFMGKAHSLAYAAMPMFFWPAPALPVRRIIADVTEQAAAEGAQRYGFAESTADWRRVVEHPDVDLVDIATPNNLHAEIAESAAAAGKHVICEKPLARSADEARRMYDAVRAAGVVHMVAYNYRRTPAVQLAKKYVAEGAIGRVISFRGTYLQDWSADPNSPLSWRFQRSVAGSGALGDIGTHVLDLARYLVGEISAVSSMLSTWIPDRPVSSGGVDKLGAADRDAAAERKAVDVDDELITMLRFEGGAIGTIEATRNAYGRNNFLTFELHGTEGSIVFNYERRDELQVCFANDSGDRRGFRTVYTGPAHPYGDALWPIPALGIGYGETKIIECHDLMAAIAEGGSVSPNFADGYQIDRIADAIAESARADSWVRIPALVEANVGS